MKLRRPILILIIFAGLLFVFFLLKKRSAISHQPLPGFTTDSVAAKTIDRRMKAIRSKEEYALVSYGRELISNTSVYLGPKGTVAAITNGMNCQNCHLEAGSKEFGNSFFAVAANYPQFRNRSGMIESIEFRINDCLQRSLNGKTIDTGSREMRSMVAYLKWLGKDVPLKTKPAGSGLTPIHFLNRAADSSLGRQVYVRQCQTCHGKEGEGLLNAAATGYRYPPLWGPDSYNTGAGMYRLGSFAGYVKYNMPYLVASYSKPKLTDEEAWDIAAFVNSRPRPEKTFAKDWPDYQKKAVDYPYGPFADSFPAAQHKFGPFPPIETAHKSNGK